MILTIILLAAYIIFLEFVVYCKCIYTPKTIWEVLFILLICAFFFTFWINLFLHGASGK
jgi:hypothetical protein